MNKTSKDKAVLARPATALIATMVPLLLFAMSAMAQQSVPFRNNIPLAPEGLAHQPLPPMPKEFRTGEGQDIRVSVVTGGLEYPWSLVFLPNGDMLVTERAGRLRVIRDGVLDAEPVAGTPEAFWAGESGLPGAIHGYMDLALHPDFDRNQLVYMTYTKPLEGGIRLGLARGRWDGRAMRDMSDIFVSEAGTAGPSRIVFGHDGTLYVTTSGGNSQDPDSQGGKVLRLNDDGSVPADNPFVGRPGHKPEIFTLGHRNSLGLAVHPATGQVWQNENGPNGGDEINVLLPGRNYGWPRVSLGRRYDGPWQVGEGPTHEGYEPPIVYWTPPIAPSGMMFYTGDALPMWTGDVFVGALRFGQIPGTGHLQRILINEDFQELRREMLLYELRQRIRDVRQGPDDLIYVVTDERDGVVLRIGPAD
jgi:aldose sugar dehydrogenase